MPSITTQGIKVATDNKDGPVNQAGEKLEVSEDKAEAQFKAEGGQLKDADGRVVHYGDKAPYAVVKGTEPMIIAEINRTEGSCVVKRYSNYTRLGVTRDTQPSFLWTTMALAEIGMLPPGIENEPNTFIITGVLAEHWADKEGTKRVSAGETEGEGVQEGEYWFNASEMGASVTDSLENQDADQSVGQQLDKALGNKAAPQKADDSKSPASTSAKSTTASTDNKSSSSSSKS